MRRQRLLIKSSVVGLALGLVIGAQAQETVRIATVGVVSDVAVYIAIEKGFFAQQGISLQLTNIRTGGAAIPLLATRQLDIAGGSLSPGLVNAIAQGNHIIVTATKGAMLKGMAFHRFIVRKDLYDAGIRSVSDLRGRKVAVNDRTSGTYYVLRKILERYGVQPTSVSIVFLGYNEMPAAFQNKAIDAAIITEPTATIVENRLGLGVTLLTPDQVVEGFPAGNIVYGPAMYERGNLGVRWMVAYLQGIAFYNRALKEGGELRQELISILKKYTPLKEDDLYEKMIWPGLREDGFFPTAYVAELQKFWLDEGLIRTALPLSRIIDRSFVEQANQILKSRR